MSLTGLGAVLDQVRGSGLPVDLAVEGTPGPLAPSVDLTAYRIIQEALTNTVRHAGAARAVVTLSYEPGFVTVNVTDTRRDAGTVPAMNGTVNRALNGTAARAVDGTPAGGSPGYGSAGDAAGGNGTAGNQAATVRSGGFGLAGIAERVASCGGSLAVGPTGTGGFAVTARLPAR